MENCSILTSIACGCDANTPVMTAVSSTSARGATVQQAIKLKATSLSRIHTAWLCAWILIKVMPMLLLNWFVQATAALLMLPLSIASFWTSTFSSWGLRTFKPFSTLPNYSPALSALAAFLNQDHEWRERNEVEWSALIVVPSSLLMPSILVHHSCIGIFLSCPYQVFLVFLVQEQTGTRQDQSLPAAFALALALRFSSSCSSCQEKDDARVLDLSNRQGQPKLSSSSVRTEQDDIRTKG